MDKDFNSVSKGFLQKENIPALGLSLLFSIISAALIGSVFKAKCKTLLMFCCNCFFKPFLPSSRKRAKDSHQLQALESFYEAQAKIYDATRPTLLKGREESLRMAISHLSKKDNLVWIDVGGGTGFNVEQMNQICPLIEHFKAIYIVDLSPSLLDVARKRFEAKGLTNIHCMLADACTFTIPYISADLITFSYSLSMIPGFHSAIDHAATLLHKEGLICCVDFGVQSEVNTIGKVNTVGGMSDRHIPWILRTFWRIWFEADSVFLDPARRDYLEYRFGTVKSLNLYNKTLGDIPYFIWLGCDKERSPSLLYRVNASITASPYLAPQDIPKGKIQELKTSKSHQAVIQNESRNLPYPSMYYQRDIYRIYYDEQRPEYNQFNDQYIYAFTWEDPKEDSKLLHLGKNDSVLAITSAGDNILSYASLPEPPRRIHCVDLNPCQGHLLELKLAAFKSSLTREEIWQIFGIGKVEDFKELLVERLAPHMSSNAFQYWYKIGPKTFAINGRGLYHTGFSRWPLKLVSYIFKFAGASGYVEELCSAKTLEQQKKIWYTQLRPQLMNSIISKLFIDNPIFLWKALGVPANQTAMMGSSVIKYLADTLDPVIETYLVSSENYFYYLCLKGRYSKDNCPDYLTRAAYGRFSSDKDCPLDRIRIHTDFLSDVFDRLNNNSLTAAIIMDHMDWFAKEGAEVDEEITALYHALAPNGRVLLRSASQHPWYIKHFENFGFKCEPVGIRRTGAAIDRVNMYSSTWLCHKIVEETKLSTLQL
ncbi:hypothetical protein FOA43_004718 [Brettanomyces nanus]|uniref:Methyltransferase domain-containing protein n=1 Tax=Eeniella nana TaxID=13502 RepID=A0A875RQK8_EENNA|nr:uncharacterized protein FOA43_004718 [Brettanomyces nanus]QPG77310.1 hypothetical protein FOA43_004718 [Brettanomyces nanus]